MARPRPRDAPVTSATLPFRFRFTMSLLLDFGNGVAWFDDAVADDLGDPAAAADDQLREVDVPFLEVATGYADVGDLDDTMFADGQAVAFGEAAQVDAAGGEVFADGAVFQVNALFAQPGVEFLGVDADGAVGATVVLAVALPVAVDAVGGDLGARDGELGH